MPLLRSAGTVTALAHMLVGCYESLGAQAVELACCTLSAICATEDFGTYREKHVPVSDRPVFADMRDAFLLRLCEDYDVKRKLRALLDYTSFCDRAARK
jgi:hypothetical protein